MWIRPARWLSVWGFARVCENEKERMGCSSGRRPSRTWVGTMEAFEEAEGLVRTLEMLLGEALPSRRFAPGHTRF